MLGMFSKKITLEEQLATLRSVGIALNPGITEQDLLAFEQKEKFERVPYQGIIEVLGIDIEREPYTPITNKLWMCDYERIEDHGAYKDVLVRLELMSGNSLGLTDIKDFVDVENEQAWIEFKYKGDNIHWIMKVDNDWLDPSILVKYDALLKDSRAPVRIYSNHTDFGQSALLGAFTEQEFQVFSKLSKVKFALIEKQN